MNGLIYVTDSTKVRLIGRQRVREGIVHVVLIKYNSVNVSSEGFGSFCRILSITVLVFIKLKN